MNTLIRSQPQLTMVVLASFKSIHECTLLKTTQNHTLGDPTMILSTIAPM